MAGWQKSSELTSIISHRRGKVDYRGDINLTHSSSSIEISRKEVISPYGLSWTLSLVGLNLSKHSAQDRWTPYIMSSLAVSL